ncbi:hypothetical protein F5Y16DRAFT_409178 [Xylariaceae sp. FL0255]|nr:hypothetical protein F5Y16DRAFT_409178 [Xylariaceae sp. FL0255]
MQGSLSYTVVATTILSFRIPEAKLGGDIENLAKQIHGDIVPEAVLKGKIGEEKDDKKTLLVYAMPYLSGRSCLETLAYGPKLEQGALLKHTNYVTHLARYFARNWLNPQTVDEALLKKQQIDIFRKLEILDKNERFAYLQNTLAELRGPRGIPLLFSSSYPQVVTHGDLSGTNILLDEDTLSISGIIDWSLVSVQPFGMEYWALRRTSGSMNGDGWSDYLCRDITDTAFWHEFWKTTGVENLQSREEIKRNTEMACKLGLIMQFAFTKTLDGKPLDTPAIRPARYLSEWLRYPSWSDCVLRKDDQAAQTELADEKTEDTHITTV